MVGVVESIPANKYKVVKLNYANELFGSITILSEKYCMG